jgi:predicted O-methyltransferase YrrM
MFNEIHDYLHQLTPQRPEVLREMEQYAEDKDFPIVGPLVGRFLYQMAKATGARRVFEMGSGFGYSAYWFSLAMGERGEIILTDGDPEKRSLAEDYFERGGLTSKFEFIVGDAREALQKTGGRFDIIFNDIDKEGYPETVELVADRLNSGGLFMTDNVIWDGKVLSDNPDQTTTAVKTFNEALYADPRFFTTIIPLRDGVSVAMRL